MKKQILWKVIAFLIIFMGVAFATNHFENGNINTVSAEMDPATLPIAYIEYDNRLINTLHGYANPIAMSMLRDAIVPLTDKREIRIWVGTEQDAYDAFSYEVRTPDGSLVENGDITDIRDEDGYAKCTSTLRMDLTANREYFYILLLTKGESQIRYYTRIIVEDSSHVDELLAFVESFHEQTFVKEQEGNLVAERLEPNASGNNNDLANVSIHSNFDTVTYANMHPSVISQVIPAIQELNEEYCVFRMSFVLAAGDDTITNYYNVTEYYKAGYGTDGKMYLWDYQRTQNELYNYKNVNTVKNWFKIGVADADTFDMLTSDEEKRVAFVREGQLWYYDYAKTNIVRVFGFWQEDYLDTNNTYREHTIKLLQMDDDGNIAFAVAGYMNRGRHEGHTGIAVYRYMADKNRTEELMFYEVGLPYAQIRQYVERMLYLNAEDTLFCYLQGTIYRVSKDGKVTELATDLAASALVVSKDGSRIAYPQQGDLTENTTINLLDLTTEENVKYTVSNQERIRTIGFVDGDFVCGKAYREDVVAAPDGTVIFPMYKLEVVGMDTTLLKEYAQQGTYILNAYTQDLDIHFDKADKKGDSYEVVDQDFITFKEAETSTKIQAIYRYSDTSLNLLYLVFPEYIYVKTVPKMLITKEILREDNVDTVLETGTERGNYYVYNTTGMTAVYADAAMALKDAAQNQGIVLDADGVRIWQKTQLPEYYTITEQVPTVPVSEGVDSLTACMEMVLQYAGASVDAAGIAGYNGDIAQLFYEKAGLSGLSLTNVSVDTVLYYLANAVPVIAKLAEDHYVVITSYNAPAIRYYDPVSGESIREDRPAFAKKMEAAGSTYITYLPK